MKAHHPPLRGVGQSCENDACARKQLTHMCMLTNPPTARRPKIAGRFAACLHGHESPLANAAGGKAICTHDGRFARRALGAPPVSGTECTYNEGAGGSTVAPVTPAERASIGTHIPIPERITGADWPHHKGAGELTPMGVTAAAPAAVPRRGCNPSPTRRGGTHGRGGGVTAAVGVAAILALPACGGRSLLVLPAAVRIMGAMVSLVPWRGPCCSRSAYVRGVRAPCCRAPRASIPGCHDD